MKKAFLKFLSILVIGCIFFSCNPSTGDNSGDDEQQQQQQGTSGKTDSGKTENDNTDSGEIGSEETQNSENVDTTPAVNRNIGVKFDFSGAQALAKLESKKDGSRAITNADELGDLVKILADGSMENAITVSENCSLSDIVAIYKSPLEDSKDIFIVFNGESVLGYEEVEKEYDWGGTYIDRQEIRVGQLICLHEDGSIADILKKDNTTDYWNAHMSLKTESVTFDAAGNLYFISSDNGDMIYQYNPKTDELTKMVAAVENTTYEKMQIDDEGEWIFVSGSRWSGNSSYFLRAIPISNPNGFVNVYYSTNSDGQISSSRWVYDVKTDTIYFIANSGNNTGLFKVTKANGFRDKTFIHSTVEGFVDFSDLFVGYGFYEGTYYWNDVVKDSLGNYVPQKIVDCILSYLPSYYDYDTRDYKRITLDDIDIRFDKWKSLNNELSRIAEITESKKNLEVFECLDTNEGRGALYAIYYHNNEYFYSINGQEGYSHNVLADIIYLKGTDILLADYDETLFEYTAALGDPVYNENAGEWIYPTETRIVRGCDVFEKYLNGNYKESPYWLFNFVSCGPDEHWRNCYKFSKKYYDENNELDSKSILEKIFNSCNNKGVKEFRLTAFQNDITYEKLYTTLTDEEAIKWLSEDLDRMELFAQSFGQYMDSMFYVNYFAYMSFLSKTCFILGTDQKATTWNCDEYAFIPYESSWENKGKLFVNDNGVFYEYTNLLETNYSWNSNQRYYYVVQVADSSGNLCEIVNKLPLPEGILVQSEKTPKRLILLYSLIDSSGAELGVHHIYSVEMETGEVINCFDNVPNRNNLEVVSFNSAGDLLYYSAVRGTSVENGIVNLITNEYNPLTVQRKMVAVYTFN